MGQILHDTLAVLGTSPAGRILNTMQNLTEGVGLLVVALDLARECRIWRPILCTFFRPHDGLCMQVHDHLTQETWVLAQLMNGMFSASHILHYGYLGS